MFKVGLGINYWDDPQGLIRILSYPEVYEFVDTIYLIDGRYAKREDEPDNPDFSIDDFAKSFKKIDLTKLYGAKQIDKRNQYWNQAEDREMDFMIVIDSDEYMQIEPEILNFSLRNIIDRPEKCFPVKQIMEDIITVSKPRLFKGPFTFRHRTNRTGSGISHGSLYEDYGESDVEVINQMYAWFKDHPKFEPSSSNGTGVPGITMWQDKTLRTRDRIIADRVYYDTVKDR